ncbi:MAG: serine hydrolase domain-containing protein [Chloroflexota bacterium]
MTSRPFRTLVWLLVAVIAACSAQPPSSPIPSPQPTAPQTEIPTASLQPSAPTAETPGVTPHGPTSPPTPPPATSEPTLPAGPIADALAPQLDQTLAEQLERWRIPGMNAEIIFPDGSRWSGADGFGDLGRELAVTPETTFVTGSITKTFVTAAIMQLQEEGVLSIEDPLSNWVPDYPNAENITLIQLMSHTSGLFDYFRHPEYNTRVFNEPDHSWTPQEILDTFVLEPYFEPGLRHKYSNTNFVLLGLVIEAATGESLGQVLRERLTEPLGLDDTFCQCAGPPPPGSARAYLQTPSGPVGLDDGTDYRPTLSAAKVAFSAGDIVATSADLADWARTVYGGHLLAPESLVLMTDYTYLGSTTAAYGLGTRTRVSDGVRMFGHTGSLRGFAAAMWHYPSIDLTIVVLTNRGRIDANPIVDALAAIALPLATIRPHSQ